MTTSRYWFLLLGLLIGTNIGLACHREQELSSTCTKWHYHFRPYPYNRTDRICDHYHYRMVK